MTQDPMTGESVILASDVVWNDDWFDGYGYDWAVCHAGSWIYWHHRYAWVAGRHRHHHSPVRWVKVRGKLGYVPIHPRDVPKREPENLRHGIFMQERRAEEREGGWSGWRTIRDEHVKVLDDTPREFRGPCCMGCTRLVRRRWRLTACCTVWGAARRSHRRV